MGEGCVLHLADYENYKVLLKWYTTEYGQPLNIDRADFFEKYEDLPRVDREAYARGTRSFIFHLNIAKILVQILSLMIETLLSRRQELELTQYLQRLASYGERV